MKKLSTVFFSLVISMFVLQGVGTAHAKAAPAQIEQTQDEPVSGVLAYDILKYAASQLCICENSLIADYEAEKAFVFHEVVAGQKFFKVVTSSGIGILIADDTF